MARRRVQPTRSNLLTLKRELDLISQGYDLLKQKRDVLVMEIMRLASDAERQRGEAYKKLERAFWGLRRANLTMGTEATRRTSLSVRITASVTVRQRSIMGVVIPVVDYYDEDKPLDYSFLGTSAGIDESRILFREALAAIAEMAEGVISVMRLAEEAARLGRRINALENIFIPQYKESIRFIREVLEEREREDLYSMKLAKARREGREAANAIPV